MIYALVVATLGLLAFAYVAAPVLRGPRRAFLGARTRADDAEQRKRAALEAIVEIEQDTDAGKLSAVDAASLRAEYEAAALAAIRELDSLRAVHEDDPLEAEIAAARASLACPRCGRARPPAEPCPRCGD